MRYNYLNISENRNQVAQFERKGKNAGKSSKKTGEQDCAGLSAGRVFR